MKNSEFGDPWLRPTVVPIVALKAPPVDGITVRASTGTDAVAPLAPASWIEDCCLPAPLPAEH